MARVVRRIVDASPLILLGKIARLEILRVGGPEVVVPGAVLEEVGGHEPDDAAAQGLSCILDPRRSVSSDPLLDSGLGPRRRGNGRACSRSGDRDSRISTIETRSGEGTRRVDARPGPPGEVTG